MSPGKIRNGRIGLRPSICGSVRKPASNDCAERNSHALTCSPYSGGGRHGCGHRMRERGFLLSSRTLKSNGLDPTTEKCVLLFQPIERRFQLGRDCVRFIVNDDQFDMDPFV